MKKLLNKKYILNRVGIFLVIIFLLMSTIAVEANIDKIQGSDQTDRKMVDSSYKKEPLPSSFDTFTEGFEDGAIPEGWLNIDSDNDGYNWDIVTSPGMPPHSGMHSAASASFISGVGPLTPDNWLIMRALTISSTSELTYWVSAQNSDWSQEHLEVWISTSGRSAPIDFTDEVDSFTLPHGSSFYTMRTVDLSSYDGETIYIAFRHCDVTNMFWIKIDDITVTGVTIPELPLPDLDCDGELSWISVRLNTTVTNNFTVENIGDQYSWLTWTISEYPEWGNWTFTPLSGTSLTPELGTVTIEVEVILLDEEEQEFTGEVKIVNTEDPDDFCIIQVSLTTLVDQQSMFQQFLNVLEQRLPIIAQILAAIL